jgi:cytochrome c oxidase subunit II
MKRSLIAAALVALAVSPVLAGVGQPTDWQLGLQEPVTEVKHNIDWFHEFLLYIITAISVFVLALLVYCCVRFNARANPKPSKTTHHVGLEIAWTIIPAVILAVIAVPSWRLLSHELTIPKPIMAKFASTR